MSETFSLPVAFTETMITLISLIVGSWCYNLVGSETSFPCYLVIRRKLDLFSQINTKRKIRNLSTFMSGAGYYMINFLFSKFSFYSLVSAVSLSQAMHIH